CWFLRLGSSSTADLFQSALPEGKCHGCVPQLEVLQRSNDPSFPLRAARTLRRRKRRCIAAKPPAFSRCSNPRRKCWERLSVLCKVCKRGSHYSPNLLAGFTRYENAQSVHKERFVDHDG